MEQPSSLLRHSPITCPFGTMKLKGVNLCRLLKRAFLTPLSTRYPPLTPFEHYDHGKDADPTFPDLLPKGVAQLDDVTPFIGTEVRGVQLSKLSDKGKDQLALFVAQRRVVGM